MAAGGASGGEAAAEEAAARRYEALAAVRAKAVKGKGAWYWAHLEPVLLPAAGDGGGGSGSGGRLSSPAGAAVKLRCSLCGALFSASNPSRTASEHLKRGTCLNFSSPATTSGAGGKPVSRSAAGHQPNSRKRSSSAATAKSIAPLAVVDPTHFSPPPPPPPPALLPAPPTQLVLSGGKADLGALAMLEDSVKRLKSPKASPSPALPRPQADAALALLADWVLESGGAVAPSALTHPKLQSLLQMVGLPDSAAAGPRRLVLPRLAARYRAARADSDARVRDALFFQVAAGGWSSPPATSADRILVCLAVNLPNGTTVFHRPVPAAGRAPSGYAEEVLWGAAAALCGGGPPQRCVGIVADRFKSKALRDLEAKHHWMVNLPCQIQAFHGLLKDFARELPLFRAVSASCSKLVNLFNTQSQARAIFHKHQAQELGLSRLLRSTARSNGDKACDLAPTLAMLEDVMSSAHPLRLAVLDEDYKSVAVEEPVARELAEMIEDVGFWTEVEAILSLVKLVKGMAQEMEAERPLVGQCLLLWDELRAKVKGWCAKYSVDGGPPEKVIEERFKKNYHPAWSAAFILDPLHLVKDVSGRYLPPFKFLTPDQEKDVDRLITRLVSREEAHIALMELMKWRSEGLDPLYAQAVQEKQPDPLTGKMRITNPQSSRLVWETCLNEFKSLGKVAARLIFLHATSYGYKCNPSLLRWMCAHGRSRVGMDRAQKMAFVAAHAKLERRDFSSKEEKDADFLINEEDDMVHAEDPSV